MDNPRLLTRTILLCMVVLLTIGSSGCSYRGMKHRVLGLAGYGCPTCGAEDIVDCACSLEEVRCAGYESTLWGELPADCQPRGEFAFAVSSDQEEKPAESVLPAEASPSDEVNPLPEPLDLDPAPAPPGRPPGVTPEGQRERDPAPPLFDPDQSTPNPFPLRDERESVAPPTLPDLFDEGEKPKPKKGTESTNPFPLKPKGNQLKEEIPDLFQQKSSPSGPSEANVVKFGRVLYSAPPASLLQSTQAGSLPRHRRLNSQAAAGRREESRTTLRLGPVLSQ